jgi:hypothetical protein
MERKINNIENANKFVNKGDVRTIITFRTQQLYDLWVNEFSGQISDGMWENSNKTEWLWQNVWVRLGNETKVEVRSIWRIGRKSFGMTKDLWDVIGDRIIEENGFANEKEARAAWREIATAIYNAAETKEAREFCDSLAQEKKDKIASQREEMFQEWRDVCGDSKDISNYSYMHYDLNEYEVKYTDGSIHKRTSYLFLHLQADSEGNLKHKITYNDAHWYVPKGQLAKAVEAIKEFDNKMRF